MDLTPQRLLPHITAQLRPGARVVVATSGGPDSQALLHALSMLRQALGIAGLWAVGIDHGLRPEAADELAVARTLATAHGIAFEVLPVHVARRGNRLAQARAARYAALETFAATVQATDVAVAHTATDQVETVLFNLSRGSALRGAGGIRPRRGRLVRPLLHTPRAAILAYLAHHGIPYAQDPSNKDLRRARARLRATVHPALAGLNPRFEAHIARFADAAREDDAYLVRLARRRLEAARRPGGALLAAAVAAAPAPLARRMLVRWLREAGVEADASTVRQLRAAATHAPPTGAAESC
jgi:tRNA(Ile)-lysidine synthase